MIETEPIVIDLSRATIKQFVAFIRATKKEQNVGLPVIAAFLNCVVVGGIDDMPLTRWPELTTALTEAFKTLGPDGDILAHVRSSKTVDDLLGPDQEGRDE